MPFVTAIPCPTGERRGAPLWLLVVASFLAGAALAAAAFVASWRHEASRGSDAIAQLSHVRATLRGVQADRSGLAEKLGTASLALRRAKTQSATLAHKEAAAKKQLAAANRALASLAVNARSARASGDALAANASTLADDVKALSAYLSQGGQLDPGYVQTQLAYLEKLAGRLRDGGPALSQQLAALERAAR